MNTANNDWQPRQRGNQTTTHRPAVTPAGNTRKEKDHENEQQNNI